MWMLTFFWDTGSAGLYIDRQQIGCMSLPLSIDGTDGPLLLRRDQPNSRFHGRDIFREIGLLP